MTKSEKTPLNRNELEIVRLTMEGESQMSIAKQLGLSASTISRSLKRPHVIEKINSATQELHYPLYRIVVGNIIKAEERIGSEIDTMDIEEVIKYTGQTKPVISPIMINTVLEDIKKRQQAEEGPVSFKVGFYDTKKIIRQEALKMVKEWGYDEPPEDIVN